MTTETATSAGSADAPLANDGALAPAQIASLRETFAAEPRNRVAQNAVTRTAIDEIAVNREVVTTTDHTFSHLLDRWTVTDQKQSGRCWLFAGMNLFRVGAMEQMGLKNFEFSQTYLFFWDKFERANYFLEAMIETSDRPVDDRVVAWLLDHPLDDGGQWNMFASLVEKYGLAPKSVMPETISSERTMPMNRHLVERLREGARDIREQREAGAKIDALRSNFDVTQYGELDYADQSAAVSPGLLGETMSALGVQVQPASFLSPLTDPLGTARRFGEDLVLELMRADATAAGISLTGVELVPLRLHDNAADLASVDYLAWTNSSKRVYVNLGEFVDVFTGAPPGKGLASVRAMAIYVLRHEHHHVTQFAGNGDAPPADFAAMMAFEEQSYGSDVTWIQGASIQTLLVTTIGAPQAFVDQLEQNAADTSALMNTLLADPAVTTDAQRRTALQKADMIPASLHGKAKYAIGDLYRTRSP